MHKFKGPNGDVFVDLGEVVGLIDTQAYTTIFIRGGGQLTVVPSAESIAALIEKELVV